MNSIEEDIEILESIVKVNNDFLKGIENQTINQKEITALQHILSDYKKLQEEFNEVDHECNRLEKIDFEKDMKIKELQKEANRYKNMYKAEHEIHLVRNEQLDRKENAVIKCNELIIENAKLKEDNKMLKEMYYKFANLILENFVSVRKIERQIEEIQEDKTSKYYDMFLEERDLEYTVKILQELLEREK